MHFHSDQIHILTKRYTYTTTSKYDAVYTLIYIQIHRSQQMINTEYHFGLTSWMEEKSCKMNVIDGTNHFNPFDLSEGADLFPFTRLNTHISGRWERMGANQNG